MKILTRILFVVFAAAALGGWADRRGFLQPVLDQVVPAERLSSHEQESCHHERN